MRTKKTLKALLMIAVLSAAAVFCGCTQSASETETEWVIHSEDTENALETTDIPGTFSYTGEKTPYYISENGMKVYYGKNGTITLPAGTLEILWSDDFSEDDVPVPSLGKGFGFVEWVDDGNGILTASVITPNYFYVDELAGSDENLGSEKKPFKSVSKAISSLDGRSGNVYVISEAIYDSENITGFDGVVTISGINADSVLEFSGEQSADIGGNIRIEHISLDFSEKSDGANFAINTNGNKFEIKESVKTVGIDENKLNIKMGDSAVEKVVVDAVSSNINVGSADLSEIVLKNGASASLDVVSENANAKIRILAENSDVSSCASSRENTGYASLEIISNGKEILLDGHSADDGTWYISSVGGDGSRVDPTETAGTFGIKSVYGKVPAAVDSEGTVYIAGNYTSADIEPDTHFELNEYTDFINYRKPLSNTYKKLTEDKKLNVVYFGGSLTAGYGSSDPSTTSWRALIGRWLDDNYPEAEIKHINRASGESGTFLGAYRVQRDVIAHKPDLVFLEYTINDKYYGSSYENASLQYETIVREIKQALPECDIVTLIVTDTGCIEANKAGKLHTQGQAHEDMAQKYNIPTVWVGPALVNKLEGPIPAQWQQEWKDYAIDIVHLNDAGNYEYYLCLREFMHNSLLCTDHSGLLLRNDELPNVVSEHLFDGNRTTIIPTPELIAESEKMGGSGFVYNESVSVMHDYIGAARGESDDDVFVFKFNGTDVAIRSNYYANTNYAVAVDGGEYVTVAGSGHAPTKLVTDLEPGEHTMKIKPLSGTLDISAIFTRDSSIATEKGTAHAYSDYSNHTIVLPSGKYEMHYYDAVRVEDIPYTLESQIGWQTEDGADISSDTKIVPDMVLVPKSIG